MIFFYFMVQHEIIEWKKKRYQKIWWIPEYTLVHTTLKNTPSEKIFKIRISHNSEYKGLVGAEKSPLPSRDRYQPETKIDMYYNKNHR